MASTFFYEKQASKIHVKEENRRETEEHDHPFAGTKPLNPVSVNEDAVLMSRRTKKDFGRPDKLENEVPKCPKTGNEEYLDHPKKETKGKF